MNKLLKIVFGLTLVLALVIGVGAVKASAETAPSAGLTMGSTGQAVTDLQNALISLGYSIPAGATGYFGSQTAAAVSAFQNAYASEVLAPIGLTSGTGFYGSLSAAKLASVLVGGSSVVGGTWPSGCTSGSGYSSTTGMPCTSTTTYPAGCTSSAGFSVTTGDSCSTTTTTTTTYPEGCTSAVGYSSTTGTKCDTTAPAPTTLEGGAGSASISTSSVGVETTAREGDADRKIRAARIEASGSDLQLTHTQIEFIRQSGAVGSLHNYVKEVSVFLGSDKVATIPITSSYGGAGQFTKSTNTYYMSVPLDNAIVKQGVANKKDLYVAVSVVDNLIGYAGTDQWSVNIKNVRTLDAIGTVIVDTASSSALNRSFQTLSSSGIVKLKIARGTNNPIVGDVKVSETATTEDVLLNEFTLGAEGSNLLISDVGFTATYTAATLASITADFKLKRLNGSNWDQVADWTSMAGNSTTTTLYNQLTINKDTKETFRVYATTKTATGVTDYTGKSLTIDVDKTKISAEDSAGSSPTKEGSANGEAQTFRTKGLIVSLVGHTSPTMTNPNVATDTVATFKTKLKLKAFGTEAWVPLTISRSSSTASPSVGMHYQFQNMTSLIDDGTGSATQSIVRIGGNLTNSAGTFVRLGDGESVDLEMTVSLNPATGAQYRTAITVIGFNNSSETTPNDSVIPKPESNFHSTSAVIQ